MRCLLCGGEASESLDGIQGQDTNNGDVPGISKSLCSLFQLDRDSFEEMLSLAEYCVSCGEVVRTAAVKLESDVPGQHELVEERRQSLRRKLVSSWLSLQSDDVHADDYCPWQSVRLRLLFELGAIIEVSDDSLEQQQDSSIIMDRETAPDGTPGTEGSFHTSETFHGDPFREKVLSTEPAEGGSGLKSFSEALTQDDEKKFEIMEGEWEGSNSIDNEEPLCLVLHSRNVESCSSPLPSAVLETGFSGPHIASHLGGIYTPGFMVPRSTSREIDLLQQESNFLTVEKTEEIFGESEATLAEDFPMLETTTTSTQELDGTVDFFGAPATVANTVFDTCVQQTQSTYGDSGSSSNYNVDQEAVTPTEDAGVSNGADVEVGIIHGYAPAKSVHASNSNIDESRGRKSRRKPLRPTKGIYSLKSPSRKGPSPITGQSQANSDQVGNIISGMQIPVAPSIPLLNSINSKPTFKNSDTPVTEPSRIPQTQSTLLSKDNLNCKESATAIATAKTKSAAMFEKIVSKMVTETCCELLCLETPFELNSIVECPEAFGEVTVSTSVMGNKDEEFNTAMDDGVTSTGVENSDLTPLLPESKPHHPSTLLKTPSPLKKRILRRVEITKTPSPSKRSYELSPFKIRTPSKSGRKREGSAKPSSPSSKGKETKKLFGTASSPSSSNPRENSTELLERFSKAFHSHIKRNNKILQKSPGTTTPSSPTLTSAVKMCLSPQHMRFPMGGLLSSSLDSPPMSPFTAVVRESTGQTTPETSPEDQASKARTRRSGRKVNKKKLYPFEESSEPESPGKKEPTTTPTTRRRSSKRKIEQQENNSNNNNDRARFKRAKKEVSRESLSDVNGTDSKAIPKEAVKDARRSSEKPKCSVLNSSNIPTVREEESGPEHAKYKCYSKGCDRRFSGKDRRDNHYKRKHQGIRNLFTCNICGKSFPARTRLATHLERHEMAGKVYSCDQCDKTFPTQKKLDFHTYEHSQNWGLYCDVCNKGFLTGQEQRLANHKKIHDESRPKPFECVTCNRTFSSLQYLNIHQKNHPIQPDEDGLYRCKVETCLLTFKAVTSYREHQRIHTGELPFACEVCGKKFGYITGYKKHMISHTDEKQHTCHICGKQFKQKGNLNLHISRHNGVKPFKCPYPGCDYSFFDQYKLRNHEDVHTGKRIYKCGECDKCFRTTTGLKSHHAAVHAKERKYKCHCGKTFSQKQYLQFHKTQHPELNLKRFTCDVCSKKFSEPSSLREHKRRFHTGETSFRCDKCDYTACFKSRMDKHMLTHSNPQFDCSICNKQFRQANNLKRHMTTVHTKTSGRRKKKKTESKKEEIKVKEEEEESMSTSE